MNTPISPRQTLQFHLSAVILILVLSVGSAIGWLAYSRTADIITEASGNLFGKINSEAVAGIERLFAPAEVAVELLIRHEIVEATSLTERLRSAPLLAGILQQSPALSAAYVGYDDGDFFMLTSLPDEVSKTLHEAPRSAEYLVQSIERSGDGLATGTFIFLDDRLHPVSRSYQPDYTEFDPRTRPWFEKARSADNQIKTRPYIFFTSEKLGTTIARSAPVSGAVVGVDIYLDTLAGTLREQLATANTEIALFGQDLKLIAHPDAGKVMSAVPDGSGTGVLALTRQSIEDLPGSILQDIAKRAVEAGVMTSGETALQDSLDANGRNWRIQVSPLEIRGTSPYYLGIGVPETELLANARLLLQEATIAIVIVLLITIPITVLTARLISTPVRKLADEAEKIRQFNFADPVRVKSSIIEIENLSRSMNEMKSTIRRFLEINRTISGETNFSHLLQTLLDELGDSVGARHGALYLVAEDGKTLMPAATMGAQGETLQHFSLEALPRILQEAIDRNITCASQVEGDDLTICGGSSDLSPNADRNAIVVPLSNRSSQLIGMMTLIREDKGNTSLVSFVDALSGSAAVALETRQLIASQKALFQAFIRMIADAIDAKSRYTGGHCARVPELTKMLADAADQTDHGPFAGLKLSEDDRKAIHIAAWLHDCGKVTTPEYVVDKATKLETLYDRIHEIRMRFEVLKRDAWISYWEGLARGGQEAVLAEDRDRELALLDEDFAFVAECNQGGEFMSPDRVERLQQIAARSWSRTLSDRLGISHEELSRKEQTPEPSLPVMEPVLADRPEHVLDRQPDDKFDPDNPWGFKLNQPEALYNRGELYNLSIAKGTLTDEERYKINDHVVQTIIMLSRLPFPQHLRNVPELAGGHHEKIDGTGYPRQLTGQQMSPIARIMAIADIFEALTATDRPYKKGKTLSEALKIMGFMVKDKHIDADLYDLFLTSGVWRDYAERFMKPEQLDEVDVEGLRSKLAA